ncbi:MAG: sugar phosphate isomerase/epimerase [Reyranella sp.]|nr:sugar phosphate isomerase/epimerase [Reyranella sp.]
MTQKFRGLALHTWTVDTTPLEQALAAAKAGGFDAIELRRVDFVRNPNALDLVKKSSLPVACVGVEPGWIFSSKGDEQERLFGVFRESCQAAVALDCPTLMSAIGPGTASLENAVVNIGRAGKIAAGFKLRLALEYQFQHPVVKSLDILRDLIARAGEKSVGLLLDAYHLQRGGRPGAGFSDVPEAELFYVQYSDVPDAPPNGPPPIDRLPPGMGVVRWTDLFRLLAAKNYGGYISYEAPNPAHWARSAADVAGEGAQATRRELAQALGR